MKLKKFLLNGFIISRLCFISAPIFAGNEELLHALQNAIEELNKLKGQEETLSHVTCHSDGTFKFYTLREEEIEKKAFELIARRTFDSYIQRPGEIPQLLNKNCGNISVESLNQRLRELITSDNHSGDPHNNISKNLQDDTALTILRNLKNLESITNIQQLSNSELTHKLRQILSSSPETRNHTEALACLLEFNKRRINSPSLHHVAFREDVVSADQAKEVLRDQPENSYLIRRSSAVDPNEKLQSYFLEIKDCALTPELAIDEDQKTNTIKIDREVRNVFDMYGLDSSLATPVAAVETSSEPSDSAATQADINTPNGHESAGSQENNSSSHQSSESNSSLTEVAPTLPPILPHPAFRADVFSTNDAKLVLASEPDGTYLIRRTLDKKTIKQYEEQGKHVYVISIKGVEQSILTLTDAEIHDGRQLNLIVQVSVGAVRIDNRYGALQVGISSLADKISKLVHKKLLTELLTESKRKTPSSIITDRTRDYIKYGLSNLTSEADEFINGEAGPFHLSNRTQHFSYSDFARDHLNLMKSRSRENELSGIRLADLSEEEAEQLQAFRKAKAILEVFIDHAPHSNWKYLRDQLDMEN